MAEPLQIENLLFNKTGKRIYSEQDFKNILEDTAAILNKQLASYGVELKGGIAGVPVGRFNEGTGAQWKTAGFADALGTKGLEKFKESVETSKAAINQIKSLLDSVQSLVELLGEFESVITDPLQGIANQVIKYIRGILDNLKSTGAYFLDLTEPYYVGNDRIVVDLRNVFVESEGLEAPTYAENLPGTGERPVFRTPDEFKDETRDQYLLRIETWEQAERSRETLSRRLEEDKISWYYRYKPTTYEDFIKITAEAFLDFNDIPEGGIVGGRYRNRRLANGQLSQEEANNLSNSEQSILDLSLGGLKLKKYRPGRPQFADNSISVVYLLAIQAPNMAEFFDAFKDLQRLFGFGDEQTNASDSNLNDFIQNTVGDVPENFRTWWQLVSEWNDVISRSGNSLPVSGGAAPDFYGLSLYSMFPRLFDTLDNALTKLEAIFKETSSGLSDLFADIIDEVGFQIQRLKEVADILGRYIDLVESFLGLSVNVLKIESQKGNYDIYEQLLSATGFPLQDTGKEQWIGGYLMCVGSIDPSAKNSVDLESIIEQSAMSFDEASNQLNVGRQNVDSSQRQLDKIMKSFRF